MAACSPRVLIGTTLIKVQSLWVVAHLVFVWVFSHLSLGRFTLSDLPYLVHLGPLMGAQAGVLWGPLGIPTPKQRLRNLSPTRWLRCELGWVHSGHQEWRGWRKLW
jgi:hypothetical protein